MIAFLRQVARALTGKVDAFEFALGIAFGILLGLIPATEIDPGTGLFGLNGMWLWTLVVFLILRASIPVAFVFSALFKLLAIAFLDQTGYGMGKSMLDGMDPNGAGAWFQDNMASWQLHTYWGLGMTLLALPIALVFGGGGYFLLRNKLPVWSERFGQTKLAQTLSGFFLFRMLRFLLR